MFRTPTIAFALLVSATSCRASESRCPEHNVLSGSARGDVGVHPLVGTLCANLARHFESAEETLQVSHRMQIIKNPLYCAHWAEGLMTSSEPAQFIMFVECSSRPDDETMLQCMHEFNRELDGPLFPWL